MYFSGDDLSTNTYELHLFLSRSNFRKVKIDPCYKTFLLSISGVVGTLFKKFRFLLPNLFITALLLLAMIAVYFFFEETLVTKK